MICKGFAKWLRRMWHLAFSQGFIGFGAPFITFEPLRATHFAFGLCFIRVPAVWKGIEEMISMILKSVILVKSGFLSPGAEKTVEPCHILSILLVILCHFNLLFKIYSKI